MLTRSSSPPQLEPNRFRATPAVSARRDALQRVISCRMLVLERRRQIERAEGVQGTDAECAFFLADLIEVEEEVATGVFRSSKRRRAFASAKYALQNWQAGDPLLAVFAEVDALYRRC